jgi:hypothetical protein
MDTPGHSSRRKSIAWGNHLVQSQRRAIATPTHELRVDAALLRLSFARLTGTNERVAARWQLWARTMARASWQ